jgi:hypothetical protein
MNAVEIKEKNTPKIEGYTRLRLMTLLEGRRRMIQQ